MTAAGYKCEVEVGGKAAYPKVGWGNHVNDSNFL